MAVTELREYWDRDSSLDQKGVRNYKRTFRVYTNSVNDGPLTVRLAWTLPRIGDIYVEPNGAVDTGARCVSVEPAQDQDDPNTWMVTCLYSSELEQENTTQENPLLRAAEISGGFSTFQRPFDVDVRGNAIVNSAGERFDPPIEAEDARGEFTIKRNVASILFQRLGDFYNTINSSAFFGFTIGQLRVSGINFNSVTENSLFYWSLAVTFQYRQAGWNPTRILDQGYYEFYAPLAAPKLIRDDQGEALSAPSLLNGTGRKLAQGGTPVYQDRYFYVEKDFNELGIV